MYPMWVVYIFIMFGVVINYMSSIFFYDTLTTERNKHQLEYAMNAASDAAIEELMEDTRSIGSDTKVVEPSYIWGVYKHAFLRSTNMYSIDMMETIESSFPSVVIAVNDGYFVRLAVDVDTNGVSRTEYRFTQKLPFARTTTIDTKVSNSLLPDDEIPAGTVVADTMNGGNIWAYGLHAESKYSVVNQGVTFQQSITGSAHDVRDINLMLLNAIEYTMFHNASDQANRTGLSIPDTITQRLTSDNVTFVGPTVFAFSDNLNMRGKTYFNYYSVGASQIVDAVQYYTYLLNGNKYYSRINPNKIAGAVLHDIYTSPMEAAMAGYSPDPVNY